MNNTIESAINTTTYVPVNLGAPATRPDPYAFLIEEGKVRYGDLFGSMYFWVEDILWFLCGGEETEDQLSRLYEDNEYRHRTGVCLDSLQGKPIIMQDDLFRFISALPGRRAEELAAALSALNGNKASVDNVGIIKDGLNEIPSELVQVQIFTDGACSGNPGPGGWAAIIRKNGKDVELSGGELSTTNNRMELMAAIIALERLPEVCRIVLTTDSMYVKKGITEWIDNWKRNGWKSSGKGPVKNKDLWMRLDPLNKKHSIKWYWIKGHNGHTENERCDALAKREIVKLR